MRMYDPRRADGRSISDKIVDMILAASEYDLVKAQSRLNRMAVGRPYPR